ncbi:hypothetical protein H6P81_009677 [Aristolochia fimbriata]|uniref:Uncharacterized protein n=1 Tax=Aristolochia fimbriata TaxID=158543 RepID=A0AAV7EQ15_ARIFI|nr:hypothetical protein H6P81_009677 [Aristolochia fimbriata]
MERGGGPVSFVRGIGLGTGTGNKKGFQWEGWVNLGRGRDFCLLVSMPRKKVNYCALNSNRARLDKCWTQTGIREFNSKKTSSEK